MFGTHIHTDCNCGVLQGQSALVISHLDAMFGTHIHTDCNCGVLQGQSALVMSRLKAMFGTHIHTDCNCGVLQGQSALVMSRLKAMFGTHIHTGCKGCGACKPPWLYPPTFDASRGGLNRGVRRGVVVICLRATLHAPTLLPDNTGISYILRSVDGVGQEWREEGGGEEGGGVGRAV